MWVSKLLDSVELDLAKLTHVRLWEVHCGRAASGEGPSSKYGTFGLLGDIDHGRLSSRRPDPVTGRATGGS